MLAVKRELRITESNIIYFFEQIASYDIHI